MCRASAQASQAKQDIAASKSDGDDDNDDDRNTNWHQPVGQANEVGNK